MAGQQTPPDVRELYSLLESNDTVIVLDIIKLVKDDLATIKESWLVHSLMDYYYISRSEKVLQILVEVQEPHNKHLIEKLNDGLKTMDHKLAVMRVLLCIACKQPIWIHKLATAPIFGSIIKCLKTETDIPVLMTGIMVLTVLLPSVPTLGSANNLQEIFNVFSRLVAFNDKKPGNVPDVFLLHLQVALYSLFHRLYGMFPYNFLTFLRHHYHKKENSTVFNEFVKPMMDRVRLHPHLITSSREEEVASRRWRQMETQDIVIDCARMSLDSMEGMWEEHSCPIVTPRILKTLVPKDEPKQSPDTDGRSSSQYSTPLELSPASVSQSAFDISNIWSPSMMIGLSTPPPSQQTTPLTGYQDVSSSSLQHSYTGTYSHTPLMTPPVDTPRATPPMVEDVDKTNHTAGTKDKKTSTAPPNRLTCSAPTSDAKAGSVPPSPLRMDFTAEPPQGTFKPVRQAIRELKFDAISEQQSSEPNPLTAVMINNGGTADPKPDTDVADTDRSDLMESFSMDTLPRVMQELDNEEDHSDDEEISELTRNGQESAHTLTAESVQRFMKKINRIRFNSLTAANNIDSVRRNEKLGLHTRARSCPHLPKIESPLLSEQAEMDMSRSVSASFKTSYSSDIIKSDSVENNVQCSNDNGAKDYGICHVVSETSQTGLSKCPAYSNSTETRDETNNKPNDMLASLRKLMMPAPITVCQRCRGEITTSPGKEAQIGMFDSFSPPELLDKHIRLGGEVHAKELSKIPITSQESVSWTHFGGMPPADEINILRGQIFMIQNQLLYERHKRELHAKRNRRLLRKITNAKALEEENASQADQLKIRSEEIQNLKLSLKLTQEENRRLKEIQESNEYETKVQMRACIMENNDLKSAKTELGTLLVRQREEQDMLKQKMQDTESKLFQAEKEIHHLQEQAQVAQDLKGKVLQLHKELLLMGELQQKHQEQTHANKRHRKQDQDMVIQALTADFKQLTTKYKATSFKFEASDTRVSVLQEELKIKDITLSELKKTCSQIKSSHNEEVQAIEEKYKTMLKINQQLEGQILQLYSQLDELQQPKQTKAPHPRLSKELSPPRERTGSDPTIVTNISKTPLYKMSSVPMYCEMKDAECDTTVLTAGSQCSDSADRQADPDVPLVRQLDDTVSLSSRESGLYQFASRTSTFSYSDGEDKSLSSKGSNLFDSGYCN